jgi:hypothetical protein
VSLRLALSAIRRGHLLYPVLCAAYTRCVTRSKHVLHALAAAFIYSAISPAFSIGAASAQTPPPQKSPAPETQAREEEEHNVIELLETRVRFEADGSSRREIHAIVRVRSEADARQFSRLSYDYNRAFEQVDLPLIRITHANGGTVDILPRAITDQPNPAVEDAPAYQDVRRKSIRIFGLQAGDTLEYRVVTNVSHHPLAPDFYFSYSLSRGIGVARESLEINLPTSRPVQLKTSPSAPEPVVENSGEGDSARVARRWQRSASSDAGRQQEQKEANPGTADIALTTFSSWEQLRGRLALLFGPALPAETDVAAAAENVTRDRTTPEAKAEALYNFVSEKIRTVDLAVGSTGFQLRYPAEVLASGYGTPEDKSHLFTTLTGAIGLNVVSVLTGAPGSSEADLPIPTAFRALIARFKTASTTAWLDPNLEVAPFRMVPIQLRGTQGLLLEARPPTENRPEIWVTVPDEIPFPATQEVVVDASLSADGNLAVRVRYNLRGDDELLFRVTFHRTPKEQWRDVAAMLAGSNGFRGRVTSVNASDPSATREPFRIEYEIVQPKFVDWSKSPAHISVPLPLLRLPELPAMPAAAGQAPVIGLGTPLEASVECSLEFPPGTEVHVPPGISVTRDYARYSSRYTVQGTTLRASRHLQFILREIPGERIADYAAFFHAVENDEGQSFTLSSKPSTTAPAAASTDSAPRVPQP